MDKKTPAGGGFSSPWLEARGLQAADGDTVVEEPKTHYYVSVLGRARHHLSATDIDHNRLGGTA